MRIAEIPDRRYTVPRGRTLGIVWPFLAIVVILVALSYLSMAALAAARGYISGESVWSKAQKEAIFTLLHYAHTRAESDYQLFKAAVGIPLSEHRARLEMEKPDMDYAVARDGLIPTVHPDDVGRVITLYRCCKQLPFMAHIIRTAARAERHIQDLDDLGTRIHEEFLAGRTHPDEINSALDRIYALDAAMTPMERDFSDTMGAAARTIEVVLMLFMTATACVLVPVGVMLSRRMVKKSYAFEEALRQSEQRFQLAVSGSNDGIWDWDVAHDKLYLSPRFKELLGYQDDALESRSRSLLARVHREDIRALRRSVVAQYRQGRHLDAQFRLRLRSGGYRWFRLRGQAIHGSQRRPIRMVGSISDVSDLRAASDQLYAEKERLHVTLAAMGDGVITTSVFGQVQYLNPSAELLTGWTTQDAGNRLIQDVCALMDEATRRPVSDELLSMGRSAEKKQHVRGLLLIARDGAEVPVTVVIAPIWDEFQNATGMVLVVHDASQERQYAAKLSHQASHDALTGLINRREFDERLRRALDGARDEQRHHAVLYLDLDQFKVVNDTCGHAAGDELIRQAGQILQRNLREGDTLARLGGDEFGVLLQDCSREHALIIAEELRRALMNCRFAWEQQPFTLGVSIGLVNVHDTAMTPAAVLSTADASCYMAKEKGRNRVHVYRPDDRDLSERRGEMEWVSRIRNALTHGLFRLYAQEIAPLHGVRHVGAHIEILLRMVEADGEVIPPMAFIPAAHRYDLMPEIDRWVVRESLRILAARRRRGVPDPIDMCSINLSPGSIGDDQFLDYILEQFTLSGVPFDKVCFEITETSAIANLTRAQQFMGRLQALGCRFALDDFGAGMSSFRYLRQLPVDYLKIDGAFVKDISTDLTLRSMVEAINQIGHVMGKQTVAEFAEDDATLQVLREIGVDYAQGYGVGRPIPFNELLFLDRLPADRSLVSAE